MGSTDALMKLPTDEGEITNDDLQNPELGKRYELLCEQEERRVNHTEAMNLGTDG